MSNCPLCSAHVPVDFGLTECESCGAQLLVHADGRIEYSGATTREDTRDLPTEPHEEERLLDFMDELQATKARTVVDQIESSNAQSEVEGTAANVLTQMLTSEVAKPEESPAAESTVANALTEMLFDEVEQFPAEPEAVVEPATEPEAMAGSPGELFAEAEAPAPAAEAIVMPEEEQVVYKPPSEPAGNDLSDIANFGNTGHLSRDGSLRYNLRVTGIDTVDVREAFREALTDRKFVWDIDQILRSIRNGEVQILDVTPVKAHVLISRLRSLPVQVKWEQYAIHQG